MNSFQNVVQGGVTQVESGGFPELRARVWSPEIKVALVHKTEYLRGESDTEREFWKSTIFNSCAGRSYPRLRSKSVKRIKRKQQLEITQSQGEVLVHTSQSGNLIIHGVLGGILFKPKVLKLILQDIICHICSDQCVLSLLWYWRNNVVSSIMFGD